MQSSRPDPRKAKTVRDDKDGFLQVTESWKDKTVVELDREAVRRIDVAFPEAGTARRSAGAPAPAPVPWG